MAGAVRVLDLHVLAARVAQPLEQVTVSATNPKISAQPPTTSPATRSVIAIATSSGRNEGGGMWTPAGGVPSGAWRGPGGRGAPAARPLPPVVTSAVDADGMWS